MKFINKALLPAWPQLAKTILAMKLIAIMMFTMLTHVSASSFSQTITLKENKVSIEKVLQLIENQSGYYFLYNSKDIPLNVDIPESWIIIFRNRGPIVLQHFDHIKSLINNCHFLMR